MGSHLLVLLKDVLPATAPLQSPSPHSTPALSQLAYKNTAISLILKDNHTFSGFPFLSFTARSFKRVANTRCLQFLFPSSVTLFYSTFCPIALQTSVVKSIDDSAFLTLRVNTQDSPPSTEQMTPPWSTCSMWLPAAALFWFSSYLSHYFFCSFGVLSSSSWLRSGPLFYSAGAHVLGGLIWLHSFKYHLHPRVSSWTFLLNSDSPSQWLSWPFPLDVI